MSDRRPTWAVIAGGGTAGHVAPALAVAEALVQRGHARDEIHFVGSARGMEAALVSEAGYNVTLLPGRGLQRGRNLRALTASARAVLGLVAATIASGWLLARLRPVVVLSVGGYAAVPCTLAAVALRVPFVVTEPNSVAGAANRLVGRFARAAAVAFPGTGLPREVVTGVPLRTEVESVHRDPESRRSARACLGVPEGRRVLGVMGGSLGALRINEAAIDLARRWRGRSDLAVHHVIGSRDYPALGRAFDQTEGNDDGSEGPAGPDGGLYYRSVEFERRVPALLAAADVMVCRAGASTVAELATAGVPAVLVPLPGAPGDHQGGNARALAGVGAAVVLADSECTGERLGDLVGALLADADRLSEMSAAGSKVAHPGAAGRVADLLAEHARAPKGRKPVR